MPVIARSALVPFAAEQLYELVNDVERYPDFLPWCAGVEVQARSAAEVVASLDVRRAGIRHRVTTRNRLAPPQRVVLELVQGPFEHFHGEWRFDALAADACKVTLTLDFEYAGRLIRMAFGPLFNRAADTMVDAFCARAGVVYGLSARNGHG